ncbi:LexA family protein [Vreelandella olivaria]|uniref:LexA family protein n=1 Tax=Vreelandella olivaria TaxID=390919 RepID=UPI00201F3E47|nr:S24 family peptidase [Halomonas olivaria]
MTMSMPASRQHHNVTLHAAPVPVTAPAARPHATQHMTRRNTYALKVRGDRMRDSNLFDGDVIIIRRYQHDTQQETAMVTINQREIALKQLSISRLGIHLWPEDAATPALFLHNCDIQVLGMVMGIEHHPTPSLHH